MDSYTKRAETLQEVDLVVRYDIPVDSNHPYFVNFSSVRGNFQEKRIYKAFNVNTINFSYDPKLNTLNKTLLFLGGMRGSGKTSEIAKYVNHLDNPNCFFCVVCNIDKELDTNDVEYMDILILQIEKLLEKAKDKGLKMNNNIIKSLQNWFSLRVDEMNKRLTLDGSASLEVSAETPSLLSFLKMALRLKAGVTGSRTTATLIRTTLKQNFINFSTLFNDFIENTNSQLRKQGIAQEILFVVDGIEKTMSADTRRKIIIEESNRLTQIKANTLFTLPIELMPEIQRLKMFSNVESFPFVKTREKNDKLVENAISRFEEFVFKRIAPELFDSNNTVRKAIIYSGGSPRELLRILEEAVIYSDDLAGKITMDNINSAIEKLSGDCAHYLTTKDLELLKTLNENNKKGLLTPYDEGMNRLMEHLIVMEYNDGSYKRVNPIVEASKIYKQYVG